MRVTVLGSGGALVTPRPGCPCRVCVSARRSPNEARGGPSVYVHDAHLLIDAPEDVVWSLNRAGIQRVDHLFITHWHPDHCAGLRVLETLTWDLATGAGRSCIDVWLNRATEARLAADLRYFASKGYCRVHLIAPDTTDTLGPLDVRWFGYAADDFLSGAVLTDGQRRLLVAMDETKDLASQLGDQSWATGCDLAVLETGWLLEDPAGALLGPPDADYRATEAGFERDTLPLVRALRPARTLLVHINADLMGRTPTELDSLAAAHPDLPLTFARDGTSVRV